MRKPLIAANWKMNGRLAANEALVAELGAALATAPAGCDVALCVPSPYLAQLQSLAARFPFFALGAQDVSAHLKGAYTGEVAAGMLQELGVQYCLAGHSERRQYHHESDALVAHKAIAAQRAGLTAVVCVGETAPERDAGQTEAVVARQLQALVSAQPDWRTVVLAYEPVWAIGTGNTATPEQAQQVHAFLRTQLQAAGAPSEKLAILYGGSMNAANAAQLLAQPDIDGGLIGGASLVAPDFLKIVAAAQQA